MKRLAALIAIALLANVAIAQTPNTCRTSQGFDIQGKVEAVVEKAVSYIPLYDISIVFE